MTEKKNIGLVTWFGTPNYGTSLQAYALYKLLEEKGFNVRIIKRFTEPFTLKNVKDNFFYANGIRRFWNYQRYPFPVKLRRIRCFCRKEMQVAKIYTAGDLQRMLNWADVFVAGSDQLWNCHDHFRSFEFLGFAKGKKRISYATSIGTSGIPVEFSGKVKEYLSNFQSISVRERSGASSIASVTGRTDIATVLDPVLLQDTAFWNGVADRGARFPDSEKSSPGDYILWYVLRQPDQEQVRKLQAFAAESGHKIVIVPSGEAPGFKMEGATIVRDAGIPEFIALVRSAALVITDSFHGTALSIVFSRPFISLKRFSDADPASQNIRIKDLLETLGIPDRSLPDGPEQGNLPAPIDYDSVRKRLAQLRAESAAWLDKALSDA